MENGHQYVEEVLKEKYRIPKYQRLPLDRRQCYKIVGRYI